MKIGLLGGSFDPIHNGHIYMARSAREAYGLDQVWLIPAGHSPNKDESKMRSPEDRLAMTELAAEEEEWLLACDYEVRKEGTSYTYLTLSDFCRLYPQHDFYYIMGGDSLDYFESWRHPEIIAACAVILVVVREGFDPEAMQEKIRQLQALFPCDIRLVPCPKFDISSTLIRSRIHDREFCMDMLNEKVYDYIQEHQLYI